MCTKISRYYIALLTILMHVFNTVNSEIFSRVLFSHMRSFGKIKSLLNGEITLWFTDIGKSCLSRNFKCCKYVFNAKYENKILAKISEFTVYIIYGYKCHR